MKKHIVIVGLALFAQIGNLCATSDSGSPSVQLSITEMEEQRNKAMAKLLKEPANIDQLMRHYQNFLLDADRIRFPEEVGDLERARTKFANGEPNARAIFGRCALQLYLQTTRAFVQDLFKELEAKRNKAIANGESEITLKKYTKSRALWEHYQLLFEVHCSLIQREIDAEQTVPRSGQHEEEKEEKSNSIRNAHDSAAVSSAPQGSTSNIPYVLSENEKEAIDQEFRNRRARPIDQNQLDTKRNDVIRYRANSYVRSIAPATVARINELITQLDNATNEQRARIECHLDLAINDLSREEFNHSQTQSMNMERARLSGATAKACGASAIAISLARSEYRDARFRDWQELNHFGAADHLINNRLASIQTGPRLNGSNYPPGNFTNKPRTILVASTMAMAALSIWLIYHYWSPVREVAQTNEG